MRKLTMTALVLGATIAMAATASAATASASADTCTAMSSQVNAALSSNQQSANYADALKEKGNGRDFCAHGMYQVGVDHYMHALKLLGVQS